MRVLMLGWEFPPIISGGLGTACLGLTKAMKGMGLDVLFMLPRGMEQEGASHVQILGQRVPADRRSTTQLGHVRVTPVSSRLFSPYQSLGTGATSAATGATRGEQAIRMARKQPFDLADYYGGNLLSEVYRYAHACAELAQDETFDVIHAHDWMTYPAGLAIADMTGKPLVVHVHSTEFDRSGEDVQQQIWDIERAGMQRAASVICVSQMTKNIVTARYGQSAEKVEVVYNGVDPPEYRDPIPVLPGGCKIVLFLGRITMQKGPEYFVAAARKVLEKVENVKFIVAGAGDMFHRMIEQVACLGIGQKVLFAGFLRGSDVDRAFRMASLYVMPSVSEPFGIAPLEAASRGVPVLISKNSGVSEVLRHALTADFWDIDEMANKIVGVLRHPPLAATLREHAGREIRKLTWDRAAAACLRVYERI
jgi:glycosyltransferase involved in cell wall biosynthesis